MKTRNGAQVRLSQAALIGRAAESRSHFIHQEWEMNLKYLIAAAAMLVSGAAFADDTYPYVDHSRFVGAKDRAAVQAELASAGPISTRQHEFVDYTHVASGNARADIRAELERAYAEGSYASNRMSEFTDFRQAARTAKGSTVFAGLGHGGNITAAGNRPAK